MLTKQCIAVLLSFVFLSQGTGLADQTTKLIKQKQGQLAWSELEALVVDRRAKTTLTDGTRIEGDVLAVRPEALVMDITKTSDKKAYPKGETTIPRNLVTGLQLVKLSGPGRAILGVVGGAGGLLLGGVIACFNPGAGVVLAWTVFVPAGATGGYYLGKSIDRRHSKLTIVSETPEAAPAEEVQQ